MVAPEKLVAADRKAIQSLRPSDSTTAFGRAVRVCDAGYQGVVIHGFTTANSSHCRGKL